MTEEEGVGPLFSYPLDLLQNPLRDKTNNGGSVTPFHSSLYQLIKNQSNDWKTTRNRLT